MFAGSHPPTGRNSTAWLCSAALHGVAAMALLLFRAAIPTSPQQHTSTALVFAPAPPPKTLRPGPLNKPELRVFKLPKLAAPPALPLPPKPVLIEAPAIQASPAPVARPMMPAIELPPPPPQVRTGMLDLPAQAPRVQARPAPLVQTAGFGAVANHAERSAVLPVATGAFGETRTTQLPNEPKRVASAGAFGSFGPASAGSSGLASQRQQIARAGFGDAVTAKPAMPVSRAAQPQPSDSTPLEITFTPKPEYTPEARRLRIEGQVVVQAVFRASGEVDVIRVVSGLGHGLDENAIAAARSIRFRPAKRQGDPLDSTATVRMTFELAY
ncbi:MAG TPA: TonB family protein [Bryobacteraceae bacterium]|nr:TonB family protein [Bryobacteraceae bacterium]